MMPTASPLRTAMVAPARIGFAPKALWTASSSMRTSESGGGGEASGVEVGE